MSRHNLGEDIEEDVAKDAIETTFVASELVAAVLQLPAPARFSLDHELRLKTNGKDHLGSKERNLDDDFYHRMGPVPKSSPLGE